MITFAFRRLTLRATCTLSARSMTTALYSQSICVHGATTQELTAIKEQLQHFNSDTKIAPDSNKKDECCPVSFLFKESNDCDDINACGTFDEEIYFSALTTTSLGRPLFTSATIPSTQAFIQENVSRLPDGIVFVADKQTGGKGRSGNTWESPAGCLMFTTACQLRGISGERLPFVQYIVTLAVVQALQDQLHDLKLCVPLDDVIRIKWPNDVYCCTAQGGGSGRHQQLKLGGILCHSFFRDGQFSVIMGVGLNVSNRQPTTCIEALVEELLCSRFKDGDQGHVQQPVHVRRETLLAGILSRLEPMLYTLGEQGFAQFEHDYYSAWLHSGQRVQLVEKNQVPINVSIQGLSRHGYLLAKDDLTGEMYELHPDGNSFDFFQGLVRRKISTV